MSSAEAFEEHVPKTPPFGFVPSRAALDKDLSKGALRLLILLCCHAGKLRFGWPGQRGLATRLDMHRRSVQRYQAELEERGYIRVSSKHGKTNGYRIIHEQEVDAYIASTPEDATSSATPEVDAKTNIEWTQFPNEVDAHVAAQTEGFNREVEQIASLAPLSAAPSSPITPETDGDQQREERVPMSSVFPPGVTSASEMIEYIRNQKAAAKKDAEAEGLVAETLDAETVEEGVR